MVRRSGDRISIQKTSRFVTEIRVKIPIGGATCALEAFQLYRVPFSVIGKLHRIAGPAISADSDSMACKNRNWYMQRAYFGA